MAYGEDRVPVYHVAPGDRVRMAKGTAEGLALDSALSSRMHQIVWVGWDDGSRSWIAADDLENV